MPGEEPVGDPICFIGLAIFIGFMLRVLWAPPESPGSKSTKSGSGPAPSQRPQTTSQQSQSGGRLSDIPPAGEFYDSSTGWERQMRYQDAETKLPEEIGERGQDYDVEEND